MIPASDLPPNTRVAELTGPLVVGYLLHWGLFGTLTVQLYLYYEAFPVDRLAYKLLVYGVYIVELAQTVLVTQDAFDVFGYGFGDIKAVTGLHHAWLTVPIMSGLVALVGQTFYAYRIHILSKSWRIPLLIVAVSLTGTVGGIVAGAFSAMNRSLTEMNNRRTETAIAVWGAASALSDIMIAVCMTYYLQKNDTGFRRTHAIVSKFIRLTIETGSATAVTAILNLIVFFAFPGRMYYQAIALIMTKLYANAILVVLNARLRIMDGRTSYSASSSSSSDHMLANTGPGFVFRGNRNTMGNNVYPNVERTVVSIKQDVFTDRVLDEPVEMKAMGHSRDDDSV